MGYRGSRVCGSALNASCLLVAVTHPKNNYSSRTPCSSLLPLLTAHAATSGKQSNFTRKSSNHNKPSEGKAVNPKMTSNLPSTVDLSHQALPPNKQVSALGSLLALPRGVLQTPVLGTRKKSLICRRRKQLLIDAELAGVPPRPSHPPAARPGLTGLLWSTFHRGLCT